LFDKWKARGQLVRSSGTDAAAHMAPDSNIIAETAPRITRQQRPPS